MPTNCSIPPAKAPAAHFEWANTQPANAIKYWNYEALPEKIEIADPFRDVTLFKIPPALKPGPHTREGMDLLKATPQLWPDRFHFYSNGKAAVRLSARTMRPRTVHDFDDPGAPAPPLGSATQFILHYACSGFEAFWNKYRTLGKFSDQWFGKTDIRAATGSSLHLESRDVVATGSRQQALDFYRRRIALEDAARAEALIRHRVLSTHQRVRSMTENTDASGICRRRFWRHVLLGAIAAKFGLRADQARAQQSFKVSKKQAGYVLRDKHATQTCAQCLYFISPNDCVVVQGPVSPNGWCTYYGD